MVKKKKPLKRKPSPPRLADTTELCKTLVAIAGAIENQWTREKIYKAVRQLQLLDKLAVEAGLLPNGERQ